MGTQNPGVSPGTGSFSCFHGEEDSRPPIDDFFTLMRRIEEFYAEAARRLPLEEMPDLFDCIHEGGHCFGLADPVNNIVLNAVALLQYREERAHADRHHGRFRGNYKFFAVASDSFSGLLAFMTHYFRYISDAQAKRYVSLASFDLSLAVNLVRHDRFASSESPVELLPDGGKIKAALRIAAIRARHPAPDVLAQLMTSEYPEPMLGLINSLREGKALSANDVNAIKNFLASKWSPPPVSFQFWCRPNDDTCRRLDDGTLLISTAIGDGIVVQVSIVSAPKRSDQPKYIFEPTLRNEEVKTKLSECLAVVTTCRGGKQPRARDDDDSPCEHLLSLKLCLLDTIHALYIKALAVLPSCAISGRLIRALLVAGHCYGPLDPVSNIILNSIWYDTAFPFRQKYEEIAFPIAPGELPRGILDTVHMARMESRSLDGLVAALGHEATKHKAFERISSSRCDLSGFPLPEFTDVAKAAKHPQYAACGSFLNSLSGEMLTRLRILLSASAGEKLPDFKWNELKTILVEEVRNVVSVPEEAPCPLLPYAQMQMSSKKDNLISNMSFIRTKLDLILREYCYQHPWEPNFKLDIVCGVTYSSSRCRSNVYHVNFLATPDDAEKNERTLFFAEYWTAASSEAPPSPPRCCPVENNPQFTGRCSFCEAKGSNVVHPASGGHFGDTDGFAGLYSPDAHSAVRSDLEGLLDADYTYFDPDRDVELAKKLNSVHPSWIQSCASVMPAIPSAIYLPCTGKASENHLFPEAPQGHK